MGWPIVNDPIYGSGGRDDVLHLHSRSITVPISKSKEPVRCIAPVPEHMVDLLKICGWTPELDKECTQLAPSPHEDLSAD
jgi:hypothetical protein